MGENHPAFRPDQYHPTRAVIVAEFLSGIRVDEPEVITIGETQSIIQSQVGMDGLGRCFMVNIAP